MCQRFQKLTFLLMFCVSAGGCATTATNSANHSAANADQNTKQGPSWLIKTKDYDEWARIQEGHRFVARLLCSDGTSAKFDAVGSKNDGQGRFIDEYAVSCRSGQKASFTVMPVGPMPEPPEGFLLISSEDMALLDRMNKDESKNIQKDLAVVGELIRKYNNATVFIRLRASLHYQAKDFRNALADLDEVIRRAPDLEVRFERCDLYRELGDIPTYMKELQALRADADPKWKWYPAVVCRIGAQRVMDGDAEGLEDVAASCSMKYETCCKFLERIKEMIQKKP